MVYIKKVKEKVKDGKKVGLKVELEGDEEVQVFDDADFWLEKDGDGVEKFLKKIKANLEKKQKRSLEKNKKEEDYSDVEERELTEFEGVDL